MDLEKIKEQFNQIAEKYDKHRKCFIPCFDDFYTRAVSLLKNYRNDFTNIVDLGAGTGILTKVISTRANQRDHNRKQQQGGFSHSGKIENRLSLS